MKITIINGNMRHGSTWHCMDVLRQELARNESIEVVEFVLPRDMPHFCNGCFSCFYHGENTCPHANSIKPIVDALSAADLVILTSPVYGFEVSGQMKALIDHLCFMWMSHRPNPSMFNKIGLTITTTAGAGAGRATKTLRNSLSYWGMKKVFSLKVPVSAMKWDDVSQKKKDQIKKDSAVLATKISKSISNVDKLPNPIFRTLFFNLMASMQKGNNWNKTDRQHWVDNGWLSGSRPF